MRSSLSILPLVLLVMSFFSPLVHATSIRCGSHLLQDRGAEHGPTMYEVLKKCGEPEERRGQIWIYKIRGKYWSLHFDGYGYLWRIHRED